MFKRYFDKRNKKRKSSERVGREPTKVAKVRRSSTDDCPVGNTLTTQDTRGDFE